MLDVKSVSNIERKSDTSINTSKSTSKTDFASYLGESSTLDGIFEKAAKKYDISVNLLKAVGKAESNFNEKAVSRSGAQGIMQLMPATAASLGVKDSFDAEENIMGGAKYLSGLLKKYDGNTKLALAAYNAGSGNVAKYGGIPPFKETQNYVVKVMKYMNQDIKTPETLVSATDKANTHNGSTTNDIGTTRPNYDVPTKINRLPSSILNETSEFNSISQDLNEIFSYDDYLYFLKTFIDRMEEEAKEEDAFMYASKQLNYNIPVMNLLNL